MSARSERARKRRVRLVGGGYRWTREANGRPGGGVKAMRRALRRELKRAELTPARRVSLRAQLRELLRRKEGWPAWARR